VPPSLPPLADAFPRGRAFEKDDRMIINWIYRILLSNQVNLLAVWDLKNLERERVVYWYSSVTSTAQWIYQPKPRDVVHEVCVFV
jgi:hypothetical protein